MIPKYGFFHSCFSATICHRYHPAFRRAFSAMFGLETSNKKADGDDDSAEDDDEVYKFLDVVSLSGSGPKSSLIAQKDSWNVRHALKYIAPQSVWI